MDALEESQSDEEIDEDDVASVASFASVPEEFDPLLTETFIKHEQITFVAELEVLKHYDLNKKEIKDENEWKQHYKVLPMNKVPKNDLIYPLVDRELERLQNMMPAEIRWHINNPSMISQFYKMRSGGYFDSSLVTVKGLQWFLRFFPRGKEHIQPTNTNGINDGYCALYLCLYELPQNVKEIAINYRLLCAETKTCHTDICVFDQNDWCHGIQTGDMAIADLLHKGIITITCFVNIISIESVNDMKLYETSHPLSEEMSLHRYEWHINRSLLRDFMHCKVGKKYEGGIYDDMWCLRCFPNGVDFHSAGMVQLYIQQCIFPKGIFRNRLRIILSCLELQKTWSTVTEFSVTGKTAKEWCVGTLLKSDLIDVRSLTFIAEICVIEQNSICGWTPICQPEPRKNVHGNFRNSFFQNKAENELLNKIIDRYSPKHNEKVDNLIKAYYPCNLFEWDINDQHLLNQFIVSKNMQKFESNLFGMGGFLWYLKVFPNGYNRQNHGYFQVFVTMASLPKFIDSVLTNIRLSCPQTGTSYTFFAEYKPKRKTWGWHRNLSIAELHSLFLSNQLHRLTFECEIKILQVVYKKEIIYEYQPLAPITSEYILSNRYEYEWRINESLIKIFRKSANGKMYESEIFDGMFCLQIYPNGFKRNEVGNLQFFIQSAAFPQGVSGILAKLELFCVETGAKWQHIVMFSVDENNWGWSDGTMSTDELYHFDSLTFRAKMQFIELYDHNGREMEITFQTFQEQMEQIQDEEKTLHESDSSHSEFELEMSDIVKGFVSKIKHDFAELPQSTKITNKRGQIRVFQKEINNDNIIDLITKFSMYKEMETQKEVIKFGMNSLNGRFMSNVFSFYHNLKWVLEGVPVTEGNMNENAFYHVMLSLCSLPSVLSEILICCRIYCNETMASSTSVYLLFDQYSEIINGNKKNLSSDHLLMKVDDDNEMKAFNCVINVLRIKDISRDLLYDHGRVYSSGETLFFDWKIDQNMIQRFFSAFKGQSFESSEVFDDLWCIGIAPKGAEDTTLDDQVIVYLQLCSMPKNVSAITVRSQLKCNEMRIKTKYAQECMNLNGYKFVNRVNYTLCSFNRFARKLKHNQMKEMTISGEVTIVRIQYDEDCEEHEARKTNHERSSEELNVV